MYFRIPPGAFPRRPFTFGKPGSGRFVTRPGAPGKSGGFVTRGKPGRFVTRPGLPASQVKRVPPVHFRIFGDQPGQDIERSPETEMDETASSLDFDAPDSFDLSSLDPQGLSDDMELDDHPSFAKGETLEIIGFDFGNFFHNIVHDLKKVAQVVGPVIATVYPPAGPAIAGGIALLNAVDNGDQKAAQQVADTKAAAAAGDQKAQDTVTLLQTAKAVIDKTNSPTGQALLQAVQAAHVVGFMAAHDRLTPETMKGFSQKYHHAREVIGADPVSQEVLDSFNKLRALAKGATVTGMGPRDYGCVSGADLGEICCSGEDMVDEIVGFSLSNLFKKVKKAASGVARGISKAASSAEHAASSAAHAVAKTASNVAKAAAKAAKGLIKGLTPKQAAKDPMAQHQVAASVHIIQSIQKGGKSGAQARVNLNWLKKGADSGDKNAIAALNMIKHANANLKGNQRIVVGSDGVVIGFSFGDIVNAVVGFVHDVISDPLKYLLPVVGPLVRDMAEGKPVDFLEILLPGVKSTLGIPPMAGSAEADNQGVSDQSGGDGSDQSTDQGAPATSDAGPPADGSDGGDQGESGPTPGGGFVTRPGGGGGGGGGAYDSGDDGDDGDDGGDYGPSEEDQEQAADEDQEASERQEADAMRARRRFQATADAADMDDDSNNESLEGDVYDQEGRLVAVRGGGLVPGANEQLQDVMANISYDDQPE